MSLYVVDANVAVKLYVPEVHSDQAIRFFSDGHDLLAPDLMLVELGNIIWKKAALLGELTEEEAKTIVNAASELPIEYYSTNSLMSEALQIALATKRAFYDSLYVAMAAAQGCQLITDDRKLHAALRSTSLAAFLTLIENY
jgi:predicted nucleic acid-binding protein